MPATRINFKYVRKHADFSKVLGAYGIELHKDGSRVGQFKCLCPFHDDRNPSMKVNTQKNIFNCFVCDEGHGNVLDFVMKLDGVEIREAAKVVADLSSIAYSADAPASKPKAKVAKIKAERAASAPARTAEAEVKADAKFDGEPYNRELTFELKNLVTDHPFFDERGLTPAMIEDFGLGIATRGIMKDRLVFPIHNSDGKLVAYCGRFVGDERPEDAPKYKQPPHFQKELELFNWHRVKGDVTGDKPVILVESFFSVVKMFPKYSVISPMGRSLSQRQIELLKDGGVTSVVVLFDGDDPGRAAVMTVGRQLLAEGFSVTAPVVPEDFKPHRRTPKEIAEMLNTFLWIS